MSPPRALRRTRGVFALAVLAICAVAVAATGATATAAESTKSYIVLMDLEPAVAYDGGVAGIPATKPEKGKKINPASDNVKRYQAHLRAEHNESLAKVGASTTTKLNDYSVSLNGYSALLTPAQAEALESVKGVVSVMEDELHQPTTDSSPAFLGLTAPGGAYEQGINGSGVIVGVIDTGIWPEHPSFAGAGFPAPPGGLLSGPNSCNFGNTAHNPNDVAFSCNNKLIGARQMLATYRALIGAAADEFNSARDDNGHGSHTASTAAGNAGVSATVLGTPRGTISGIAPRAHVIAYKGLGNLGGFTSDLAAAIDQAVLDGVDVINYSIGSTSFSPIGADELSFLFAADAGVFVANSAGNNGPGASTIFGPAYSPWITSVGASTQRRFFQGTVVLGNGQSYAGASITPGISTPKALLDAADLGNPLCNPATPFTGSVLNAIVICQRGVVGRVAKSLAVLNAGGAGMIMHETTNTGNLFSDSHFVPSVHVDLTPGTAIKAYADTASPTARIVGQQVSTWVPGAATSIAPSMTDFSSRGPNLLSGDIIKPDITAPGIQILAGNSPFPDPGTAPTGELFQAIAGTSMSSPHIAGIYALLKQVNPTWSAAAAKSALMTTSYQSVLNNDRVTQATPFQQGAGHVNPGRPQSKGSAFQPGLVYDAGFFDYLGFLCDADPSLLTPSTCPTLEGLGIATKAYDLNLASIGVGGLPGAITVKRTVTSVAKENANRTYTVSVVEPEGYDVSVSPSSFSLRSGESRTYEVTITNVSAPIGQFRFGSLTWSESSGQYKAYSPIAVRGSLFQAPAEVTGTGGPISYDVKFGYTGAFSATGRGLVEALTNSGTIQDDPGNGACTNTDTAFNVRVPVTIPAGTTYARFQLFDADVAPNTDIDMCVFNAGGTQVGSSGGGTSAELVNLLNPAAGTYQVALRGFAVPAGGSPFTLYSWVLGSTAAGNMSVSAPTSATIGTTGTINLTFSGLTSGRKYLGSVAYSGTAGLPNPTIVRVDAS